MLSTMAAMWAAVMAFTSLWPVAQEPAACERYASIGVRTGNEGLGHRFGDIVFTIVLAKRLNAVPVFGISQLPASERGIPWLAGFLGLPRFHDTDTLKAMRPDLEVVSFDDWMDVKPDDRCGVLYTSSDLGCKSRWCFEVLPGTFAEAMPFVRDMTRYAPWGGRSESLSIPDVDPECLTIAVHVRTGDMFYGCDGPESGKLRADMVLRAMRPKCAEVFFISAGALDAECQALAYSDSPVHVQNRHSEPTLQSFMLMVSADVLVSTGSSMPIAAATVVDVVHIAGFPKEKTWGAYVLPDDIHVEGDGLTAEQAAACCERVARRRGVDKCGSVVSGNGTATEA